MAVEVRLRVWRAAVFLLVPSSSPRLSSRMDIRAVIFDMDGLMIDTESLYWAAGREVARRYGKDVADATLGRMMGRSPVDSMRVFATELGIEEDYAKLLEERDVKVFSQMQAGVTQMPGLLVVLVQLKSRFRLGI